MLVLRRISYTATFTKRNELPSPQIPPLSRARSGRLRIRLAAMKKNDYIAQFQTMIQQLHNCTAVWHSTVLVHDVLQGRIVWEGDVEVFDLTGHPTAKRCYGWSNGEPGACVTILQSPTVRSPLDAIRTMTGNRLRRDTD